MLNNVLEIIVDLIFNKNHGDESTLKTLIVVMLKILIYLLILSVAVWIALSYFNQIHYF